MAVSKKDEIIRTKFEERAYFTLFAIVAPEMPARMAWLLNGALGVDFEDKGELTIKLNDRARFEFPVFIAQSEFEDFKFTLFTNQWQGYRLVEKKFRNIDYFLHCAPTVAAEAQAEWSKRIGRIPAVTYCQPVALSAGDEDAISAIVNFYCAGK